MAATSGLMPRSVRTLRDACGVLLAWTLLCGSVHAVESPAYPTRPIRMVVPYVAGASFDTIARILAQALSDRWNQQVITDNRPGASGIIGTELVARAASDGHTLGLFGGNQALSMAVRTKLPWDLRTDFAAITRVATLDNVIVVHPSLGVSTLRDLTALLRASPGKYSYGSGGAGGDTHFAGALFSKAAGVDIVHVPYKGGGLAVTGLLGNEVQLMIVNMISAEPQVRVGRLRGIAVAARERSFLLPDVPTAAEAGLPGFEWAQWYGVFAPAKTPQAILTKLHAELARIVALPETRTRLASLGAKAVTEKPEDLERFVRESIDVNRRIARDAGITVSQ